MGSMLALAMWPMLRPGDLRIAPFDFAAEVMVIATAELFQDGAIFPAGHFTQSVESNYMGRYSEAIQKVGNLWKSIVHRM